MSLRPLRARRRFEVLEARIAPSDTLLVLGAAALAARHQDAASTTPPKPAEPRQPWTPEKLEVRMPSIVPPEFNHRVTAESLEGLRSFDGQLRDDLGLDRAAEIAEALGEALGPNFVPPEPASPRPAAPPSLGIGSSPSPLPGGGSGGSAGGGGGGGGGSPSPSQALTATTDVVHAAAPAPDTSGTTPTSHSASPMDFGLVANDDYFALPHDGSLSGNVTTNDVGAGTVVLDSSTTNGQLQLDQTGSFFYQPNGKFVGVDTFAYHLVNFFGVSSNVATVTLDVQEHAPQAADDYYTLKHDFPFSVTTISDGVLGNDHDADSTDINLQAVLVTAPADGVLALNSDGTFAYTPKAGEVGSETFTYNAVDTLGETSTATVTLNVVDPNLPVALNDGIDPSGNVIWQTGWRKNDDIDSSYGNNVLVNDYGTDYDADGDPLRPVLDSEPAGGSLQLVYNAAGDWTGDFTYIPAVGFSGIDTFTYHDNDGAKDGNVATVYIRVQKVDIDLYDGGHPDADGHYVPGNEVPDAKELKRGAYAVTNGNDTNGDGIADFSGSPVIATNKGYDEYDLMKLVINPPNPVVEGFDNVEMTLTPGLDIWEENTKIATYPHDGDPGTGETFSVPLNVLPLTLYVEATYVSQSLRDMWVKAEYANTSDRVAVTGIWVAKTGVTYDEETQDQLKAKYEDLPQAIQDMLPQGSGVLPSNSSWTQNIMVLQFTVYPLRGANDGTWANDNIYFDPTRQAEARHYYKNANGWHLDTGQPNPDWPTMVEEANDDPSELGESDAPSTTDTDGDGMQDGHIYDVDTPGLQTANPNNILQGMQKLNAIDFVRVEIDSGQKVSGNGWLYSRGSDVYPWHSEVWVVQGANGNLVRNPDGSGGPSLHNEIGVGDDLDVGAPT